MSGQNCEPLIAELKKLVTVENDQAYKLLQELLSGVTTLERQLAEVRGELEESRFTLSAREAGHYGAIDAEKSLRGIAENRLKEAREFITTLHSQLQQAREERDEVRRALENCYLMAKKQIVRFGSLGGVSSIADVRERWKDVARFCESAGCESSQLREPLPAAGDGGEK
jgi:flagellar biosynthesis chaperone FliJ